MLSNGGWICSTQAGKTLDQQQYRELRQGDALNQTGITARLDTDDCSPAATV